MFLDRFPHPITFAGMLEMSSMYLPVITANWNRYISECETIYEDHERQLNCAQFAPLSPRPDAIALDCEGVSTADSASRKIFTASEVTKTLPPNRVWPAENRRSSGWNHKSLSSFGMPPWRVRYPSSKPTKL